VEKLEDEAQRQRRNRIVSMIPDLPGLRQAHALHCFVAIRGMGSCLATGA